MKRNQSIFLLIISSFILLISCTGTIKPPECIPIFFEDFESGDFDQHDWVLNGNEHPEIQNQIVYHGNYSAKAGNILQFQSSSFEITLNLSKKVYITFFRKVDCDPLKDSLEFFIDDQSVGEWAYKSDWEKVTRLITPEGTYTLKWEYNRHSSETDFQNSVYVDNITVTPCATLGEIVFLPDESLQTILLERVGKDSTPIYSLELKDMTSFHHENSDLSDLTGLEYAKDLRFINIFNNEVESLGPLSELSKLEVINAGANKISDLNFAEKLTNIKIMSLTGNEISTLTPIQNAINLTELKLGNNNINDLSPLENLVNLEILEIYQNEIEDEDLVSLSELTNLKKLDLMTCSVTDITPLASLTELTYFRIMNNHVEDISILQYFTEIEELNLKYNEISDIEPLVDNSGLGEGDVVYITGNNLDLTEGSEDMQNIEELETRGVVVYY
ncbi:MAG: hypothetical protein R6U52_02990 [Kosmotogaceae bacterium]